MSLLLLCRKHGLALAAAFTLAGCLSGTPESTSTPTTSKSTSSTTPSTTSSVKAFKVVFKTIAQGGSFANSPPTAGTTAEVSSGWPATKLFKTNGDTLATDSTSSDWPSWLSRFEVTLSGTSNSSATGAGCARFSESSEVTAPLPTCFPSTVTAQYNCGVNSEGQWRVSEYDCANAASTPVPGTGAGTDGIAIRALFNRSNGEIAATENLMVTIEYTASSIRAAPTTPTSCFSGGVFSPTAAGCADQVWQAFLRSSWTGTAQPFHLLIPPTQVATNKGTAGTQVRTAQLLLPLASDSSLNAFQLSRMTGADSATIGTNCTANSPLCLGVIIYSMTFFRM